MSNNQLIDQNTNTRYRYFYTDPLAAAWMAKHFGMKVTRTHCHRGDGQFGESMRPIPVWILARDVENQVTDKVRYDIHPDSIRLLKPQVGDMIVIGDPRVDAISGAIVQENEGNLFVEDMGESWPITDSQTILQRNGKPFFWPESEAV